ncbi:VOC family protein [Actinocrispum sp. NPDC049592]|uniref:VOC family protein n=1 Tax=Actinocrispum sp. NPDC049592 TaxID=3154835 RepID=UPI003432DA00
MAHLRDLVIDCHHPAALARFWAQVLDDYAVAPYGERELERLREQGITDPEDDPTVLLQPATGGLRIWFQQVPESKVVKNRVHFDVNGDYQDIIRAGAVLVEHFEHWTQLADPEGNEFCVFPV